MKNNKKNFATFSIENLSNVKKLDNNQMNSLVGGCQTLRFRIVNGIIVWPDITW